MCDSDAPLCVQMPSFTALDATMRQSWQAKLKQTSDWAAFRQLLASTTRWQCDSDSAIGRSSDSESDSVSDVIYGTDRHASHSTGR